MQLVKSKKLWKAVKLQYGIYIIGIFFKAASIKLLTVGTECNVNNCSHAW
jgi:hypothetical protein